MINARDQTVEAAFRRGLTSSRASAFRWSKICPIRVSDSLLISERNFGSPPYSVSFESTEGGGGSHVREESHSTWVTWCDFGENSSRS